MEINEIKKIYQELKRNRSIIETINTNFFLETMETMIKKLEQAERKNHIKDGYLELIHRISYDYDGYNTVESLKKLIDELNDLTVKALKNDDKSIMYWTVVDLKKRNRKRRKCIIRGGKQRR